MQERVKGITGATTLGPAMADAFALIERHDKRVMLVCGPEHLLDQVRAMTGTFNAKDDSLWGAKLKTDESVDHLYVTD